MSKLSPGTVIVAIFAVLFGLVGAYAVRKALQQPPQVAEEPRPDPMEVVPIASIDLEPGRPLTMGDIAVLRLRPEQIKERDYPAGYMRNTQQIIGRTLRKPIPQGQPFVTSDFYPQGLGPTVADRLKPGLRAVTVPIVNANAVAGMASPGTYVDVLFRTSADLEEELPETTVTLLESVEVLALGNQTIPGMKLTSSQSQETTVTLAVSPEQAAALRVVAGRGELSLAVRSPDDLQYASETEPQTLESLLGIDPPAAPARTDVYRGTSKQTYEFELEEPVKPRITARPLRRAERTGNPAVRPAATPIPPIAPQLQAPRLEAEPPAAEAAEETAARNEPAAESDNNESAAKAAPVPAPSDVSATRSRAGESHPAAGLAALARPESDAADPRVNDQKATSLAARQTEPVESLSARPAKTPVETWKGRRYPAGRFVTRVYAGTTAADVVFEDGKRVPASQPDSSRAVPDAAEPALAADAATSRPQAAERDAR